jgi:hypothetical protein
MGRQVIRAMTRTPLDRLVNFIVVSLLSHL